MDAPTKIRVDCASCGKRLAAPASAAGKSLRCPSCSSPITVPPQGPHPRAAARTLEPESDSAGSTVVYIACAVVAVAVCLAALYLLLDSDDPEKQLVTAPGPVSANEISVEELEATTESLADEPAGDPAEEPIAEPENEIDLERAAKMTGHDWVNLDAAGRLATVKLLAMILTVTDQNVRVEDGALTVDEFLDAFYSNLDVGIYKAGDAYLEHLRGFELRATGPGNMTTDSFYFPGDGYLMFKPVGTDGGYSVSIHDDETTRIAKANVLMQFQGLLQPQLTRLRIPEGMYYLEINSTVAWEAYVVNRRGMAWLKRVMADEEERKKAYENAAGDAEN
jgi:DNA-directed RNA polymerase subunit RPC12/RpoP